MFNMFTVGRYKSLQSLAEVFLGVINEFLQQGRSDQCSASFNTGIVFGFGCSLRYDSALSPKRM